MMILEYFNILFTFMQQNVI